jgi:hypothetical protein
MKRVVLIVLALVPMLPVRVAGQPSVGGATIRPDGPGRYVVENSLGQQKGTVVEVSPGIYRFRNELGQLSDWSVKKRADGGWDYVPDPFHKEKKSP